MKYFISALFLSHVLVVQAISNKYKQTGSPVDRSNQMKKPIRQNGNAIVKRVDGHGEISSKLRGKDTTRVAMASDDEDLDYPIRKTGRNSSFRKSERLRDEGNPGMRGEERINDRGVDASAIKLRIEEGGDPKVEADVKGERNRRTLRSLAESDTIAVLSPGPDLNVCYETTSLINYVGEELSVKVALCETGTGAVLGGDGVLSGWAVTDVANVGGDRSTIPIPESGEDGFSVVTFTPDTAGVYSIAIDVDLSADGEFFQRQAYGVIAVSEKQLDSVESVPRGMEGDSTQLTSEDEASGTSGGAVDDFFLYDDGAEPVDEALDDFFLYGNDAPMDPVRTALISGLAFGIFGFVGGAVITLACKARKKKKEEHSRVEFVASVDEDEVI